MNLKHVKPTEVINLLYLLNQEGPEENKLTYEDIEEDFMNFFRELTEACEECDHADTCNRYCFFKCRASSKAKRNAKEVS